MWQKDRSFPNTECFQQMYQPSFRIHKLPSQLGSWMRQINVKYFLFHSSRSSRVKAHWLSLPSGKYSDLWSEASNQYVLPQKPHISVNLFMGLFLIPKDTFLCPSDREWLWPVASWRWVGQPRHSCKGIWGVAAKDIPGPPKFLSHNWFCHSAEITSHSKSLL